MTKIITPTYFLYNKVKKVLYLVVNYPILLKYNNLIQAFFSYLVPLPPAGELRVRDVTHSTMRLIWDAAPGAVRKYRVTYQPEDGDVKDVSRGFLFSLPSAQSSHVLFPDYHTKSGACCRH